jgi:hypothetical protein
MFSPKNAQDLVPGDRIITDQKGTIQTVTARTELDQYGGCSIFTENSEIITGLPCSVKVLD